MATTSKNMKKIEESLLPKIQKFLEELEFNKGVNLDNIVIPKGEYGPLNWNAREHIKMSILSKEVGNKV